MSVLSVESVNQNLQGKGEKAGARDLVGGGGGGGDCISTKAKSKGNTQSCSKTLVVFDGLFTLQSSIPLKL